MFKKLSPSASAAPAKSSGTGCLTLFGLPFFAAGIFLSYFYFSTLTQWWSGRAWVEVPCRIESADLKYGSKGSSGAVATYRYRYDGRDYTGDRVSFTGGSDSIGSFQHDVFRELSAHRENGQAFRCFVDPAQPSRSVLYRTLRWELPAFISIFALTFPVIGTGMVVGGLLEMAASKKQARLREQAPGEPWKWNPAWTGDAIPEDGSDWKTALHAYTIWSGLIIFPMLAAMAVEHSFGRGASMLVLIFPALWCLPAWFSLKRLRHVKAVGKTRLDLASRPVNPGGTLHAQLLLSRPLPARAVAGFTLICEKSITTRGMNGKSSTTTEKIWSHKESVPADRMLRDLSGFRLPVSFTLPADAPETTRDPGDEPKIAWKLDFAVPGTAIRSRYLIPVFQTGTPSALPSNSVPLMREIFRGDLGERLRACKLRANFSPDGQLQSIICPPARYLATIMLAIVFGTIWTAMCVGVISKSAPQLFALVFYGVGAAVWVSVIWMALHKRTVNFTATGLEVQHRFGPISWGHVFPKSQIQSFSHDTPTSSGNNSYYRVRLESVTGKKATLADAILGEPTAAALKERLEEWKAVS